MRRRLLILALAGAALSLGAAAVKVPRSVLAVLEKNFDQRMERYIVEDPFFLLGTTRGVYLDGYGAVFTCEVNLITGATITPFRPRFTKEEIARLRQKKLDRLPRLRQAMRDMLVSSATALTTMPEQEQVVVGVSLFYFSWEDASGLPLQILMQASRRQLLDFENGRVKNLDEVLRVQEF